MTPYDMIKAHLDTAVPFARYVGVTLLEIGDGTASAELDQREGVSNHIGSMHAGAMFSLGEAASGAALAGALAPVILQMRPVAANASIAYKKVAKGKLTAYAKASRPGGELMQVIKEPGHNKIAPKTINSHIQMFKMFFDWAERHGHRSVQCPPNGFPTCR